MSNYFKKVVILILNLILVGSMLTGCDSKDKKSGLNKTEVKQTVSDDKIGHKENTDKPQKSDAVINKLNEIAQIEKEISITNDPSKIKEKLKGFLGKGEVLEDVTVDCNYIILKVDLGNKDNTFPIRDVAEVRYSGLSEKLLLNKGWKVITINFVGVGSISMNTSDAVEGKYFNSLDIKENFKK